MFTPQLGRVTTARIYALAGFGGSEVNLFTFRRPNPASFFALISVAGTKAIQMKTHKELLDERMAVVTELRGILDEGTKNGQRLSPEQDAKVETLQAAYDELTVQCDGWEKQEAAQKRLAEFDRLAAAGATVHKPEGTGGGNGDPPPADERNLLAFQRQAYHKEFLTYLKSGIATPQLLTLQSDNDVRGGYTVVSEIWVNELIKNVDNQTLVRGISRHFGEWHATALSVPVRTAVASSFAMGGELEAPTADTALRFGKRQIVPHHFAGEIGVSKDLLRNSMLNMNAIIQDEIARDVAEGQEQLFMTGSGELRPLGLFTASNDGISTGRDVSTGNSATAIAADGLIEALYSLKAQYQNSPSLRWLFSRTALKNIRKLKTGDGQYLWAPGLVPGQPEMILGHGVIMSEFVPATFTSGLYVGMVGDFNWYWIVDDLDFQVQPLYEISARQNMVVFLYRGKFDAAPAKEEAFARVKLG